MVVVLSSLQIRNGDLHVAEFKHPWPRQWVRKTDAQMARLQPFFPKSHGKPRVDDRRVVSGIYIYETQWLAMVSRAQGLRSYGAALRELGICDKQKTGRWANNRSENSHQPFRRRERAMLRIRRMRTLQKFASVHASVHNHFNQEHSLSSREIFKLNRAAALAEWRGLLAA